MSHAGRPGTEIGSPSTFRRGFISNQAFLLLSPAIASIGYRLLTIGHSPRVRIRPHPGLTTGLTASLGLPTVCHSLNRANGSLGLLDRFSIKRKGLLVN